MSLFCNHIYKDVGKEYLETRQENAGSIVIPSPYDMIYSVYLIESKCLKCGKKKFRKVNVLEEYV